VRRKDHPGTRRAEAMCSTRARTVANDVPLP
jgi:hypothetical protein